MRIKCFEKPEKVEVLEFDTDSNQVEVRIYENVQEEEKGYSCDAYILKAFRDDNLKAKILDNFAEWVIKARYSETGENASILRIAKEQALDEYTQKMIESEAEEDGNTNDAGKL